MGRKSNWFRAVKVALTSECKNHKDERSTKSKKKWFLKKKKRSPHPIPKASATATDNTTNTTTTTTTTTSTIALPLPPAVVEATKQVPAAIPSEKVKAKEEEKEEEVDEQKRHAESIAIATAKAAEAAAAAAAAAAELVRLTNSAPFTPRLSEDFAAVRIQTAFRVYLARRALIALRGLATLQIVMQGKGMKRTTANTLKSMQSLARVQSQVRTKRLSLSEDNKGRKGHTPEKQDKELERVENLPQKGKDSMASPELKEQNESRIQSQQKPASRRERAQAYSLNHNQKRSLPTSKSAQTAFMDVKSQHSGWSWLERWLASKPWETANNKLDDTAKQPSPNQDEDEEDSKSPLSVQSHSDNNRQGSSLDDENDSIPTNSPAAHTNALPSYMAPTQSSAGAKKRADNKPEATDRLSVCSTKKTRSRHSTASIADASSIAEQQSFVTAL